MASYTNLRWVVYSADGPEPDYPLEIFSDVNRARDYAREAAFATDLTFELAVVRRRFVSRRTVEEEVFSVGPSTEEKHYS